MNSTELSTFGLAPIKREGSIANPDDFIFDCACEICAPKYEAWRKTYREEQSRMRKASNEQRPNR